MVYETPANAVDVVHCAQVVAELVRRAMGPLDVALGEGGVGGADGNVGVGCCVGVGVGCWVGGGGVVGGLATQSFKVTESMRQPLPATLGSLPSRQRNWTL